MNGIIEIKDNLIRLNDKVIRDISKEIVNSLAEEIYNKLLLLKLGAEVDTIKSGKIRKVSAKELKEALSH